MSYDDIFYGDNVDAQAIQQLQESEAYATRATQPAQEADTQGAGQEEGPQPQDGQEGEALDQAPRSFTGGYQLGKTHANEALRRLDAELVRGSEEIDGSR